MAKSFVDKLLANVLPVETLLEKNLVESLCEVFFPPEEAKKQAEKLDKRLDEIVSGMLEERNLSVHSRIRQ